MPGKFSRFTTGWEDNPLSRQKKNKENGSDMPFMRKFNRLESKNKKE
jgi:hypothetical protein